MVSHNHGLKNHVRYYWAQTPFGQELTIFLKQKLISENINKKNKDSKITIIAFFTIKEETGKRTPA